MDDLLNEFLTETAESIDEVDNQLVQLEQDPNNKSVLDNIFRLVHTIKGTCGFLGLPRLESVAHAAENVLGQFRDGILEVTPQAVTVILESLDRIKEILAGLEEMEEEPAGDDSNLIARLDAIIEGGDVAPEKPEAAVVEDVLPEPTQSLERELRPGEVSLEELEAAFAAAPGPDDMDDGEEDAGAEVNKSNTDLYTRMGGDDVASVAAQMAASRIENNKELNGYLTDGLRDKFYGLFTSVFKDQESSMDVIAKTLIKAEGFEDEHFEKFTSIISDVFGELVKDKDACDDAMMTLELTREVMKGASLDLGGGGASKQVALASQKAAAVQKTDKAAASKTTQNIRVNVDLLEDLMNMVSELVLTRNQLMQMVRNTGDTEFSVPLQRLSQCTTELQEGIMKTRMQPIGNAWNKLPRIVRDLAVELEKNIELEMKGAETELDRQVLELIKDPLTHMVRNSADHGIEPPAERIAMGKIEKGTIRLNAFHEGGHIIIEIADDGRGISVSRLKAKAIEKGLLSEVEAEQMSDAQIQKLIFHPGFSTAQKITNVSGRGVGMDVVRSNIEKIGGTIDMTSVEGSGTTMSIKIPLTLAIVSALVVEAHKERFAIPQISVLELVRTSNNSEYQIEHIKSTPVLRLRNRLLPLVYLNEVLGFASHEDCSKRSKESDEFIVVAQVGAFTFGIVVDAVFDTEEIVVKPVAPILKELNIYSGNTILGDGSVIMILDPNGIANLCNASDSDAEQEVEEADMQAIQQDDNETMLVFRAGGKSQKAVPLALVARLEDFDVTDIEESDGKYVVQYRGSLMPLVLVSDRCKLAEEGRQGVLVFADGDRVMGLAVDEILDIVEDKLDVEISSDTVGYIGSAVIDGKATEIVDVAHYLGLAFADRTWSRDQNIVAAPVAGTKVLLIDDSSFFRNMLKPLLQAAGYKVTTAVDASEALGYRDQGQQFDLIISDIEMPGMSGFELATELKSSGKWADTPLVALSNRASDKDLTKGRQAGFNDYVAKFDRDALLQSLSQQLRLRGDVA